MEKVASQRASTEPSISLFQAGIVKLVADKVSPADRCQILMLLNGIISYVEKFDTSEDVVYEDPLVTLKNLVHTIEDVSSVKEPLPRHVKTEKNKSAVKHPRKAEVTRGSEAPKQAVTLFCGPSPSKALSTPKVSSRAAVKRPPPQTVVESDSDHDGGYEQDYSYDGYDNTVQTQEEVVVDSGWRSLDALEKALTDAISDQQVYQADDKTPSSTSKVQVSKKKKRRSTKGTKAQTKPFLEEDATFVNPTPRIYSTKYGGKKWPANQAFVCIYCRQIQSSIKIYKDHLRIQHKDESPVNCRFCKAHYTNSELFNYHSCAKSHICKICKKSFPRPSKLKRHMETHNKLTVYRINCEICLDHFPTVHDCAVHVYNEHENVIHCDCCLKEFEPSEHKPSDPGRAFCKECAEKSNGDEPLPAVEINPNRDIKIRSLKSRFFSRHTAETRPAGVPPPSFPSATNEYCEVCDEHVPNLTAHLRTNKHLFKEAQSQGKDIVTYQCNHNNCGKEFMSEERLQLHTQKVHSEQKNFSCKMCDKSYVTKAAYKQHLQSHFSEDQWGCPVCGKGFKSKGVLEDHKRSIHRDTYGVNLKCPHCEMVFTDRRVRTKHINIYHKNFIYRCKECNYETREPSYIKAHYKKHTEVTFTTPKDYREVGEGPPPFTPSAGDAANQMDLDQNIKETTRKVAYGVVTLHEDLNFPKPCKACDKTISDVEEMRKHLSDSIIHADNIGKRGYFSMTNPCGYCEKEFATGAELDEHTWAEHLVNGKVLFNCINCRHGFLTVARFRYHFDAKICSAMAGCGKCKKVFENKSKLERHLDEVHKVKDAYKCRYCSKGFITPRARASHTTKWHFFTIYSCRDCDYQTRHSDKLKSHVLEKHNKEFVGRVGDWSKRADGKKSYPNLSESESDESEAGSSDIEVPIDDEVILSDDDLQLNCGDSLPSTIVNQTSPKHITPTATYGRRITRSRQKITVVSNLNKESITAGRDEPARITKTSDVSAEPPVKQPRVVLMSASELVKRKLQS